MENASFVITTSFHGTAFATIFHKPLFAVVQDTESEDGRMQTLLNALRQKDSLVYYKSEVSASLIHSDTIISKEEKLNAIRQKSEHLLIDSINTINKNQSAFCGDTKSIIIKDGTAPMNGPKNGIILVIPIITDINSAYGILHIFKII